MKALSKSVTFLHSKTRQITARLLTLCLLLTMIPFSAMIVAADTPIYIQTYEYPYGQDMSTAMVSLLVDSGTEWQWQVADIEDGVYQDIGGATAQAYTFTPINGKWYRCVTDGLMVTKPVQLIKASASAGVTFAFAKATSGQWYITNGVMGYSVWPDNVAFDVVGKYTADQGTADQTTYWLNTSYNRKWSVSAHQAADMNTLDFNNQEGNGQVDWLKLTFDAVNSRDVLFSAKLKDTYRSMTVGTDTQLGTSSITSYSDTCSLKAVFNKQGALRQIQMVGAYSLDDALDTDPAFVFLPSTALSQYWIGYWSDRQAYTYNNRSASSSSYEVDAYGHVIEVKGTDSGMVASYEGQPAGSVVQFAIRIGSVADTGAQIGNVEVGTDEVYTEVSDNFYYRLLDPNGAPMTDIDCNGVPVGPNGWVLPSDQGALDFTGLTQDTVYIIQAVAQSLYNGGNPYSEDIENVGSITTKIDTFLTGSPEGGSEDTTQVALAAGCSYIRFNKLNTEKYTYILRKGNTLIQYGVQNGLLTGLEPLVEYTLTAVSTTNNNSVSTSVTTLAHRYAYAANGAVFTAACTDHDCTDRHQLSILAPTVSHYADGGSIYATLSAASLLGQAVQAQDIRYYSGYGVSSDPLTIVPETVGRYTAAYTLLGETIYVTYAILPATPILSAPTANTLIYNGAEQVLINAGSAVGGTVEYSLNGSQWSTSLPTATKADGYTVHYRVVGDDNYTNLTAQTLPVVIQQKELTGTADILGQTVYGETLTVSFDNALAEDNVAYQWYRDGAPIPNAASRAYTLSKEDVGCAISVTVTGINNLYGSVSSLPTDGIAKKQLTVMGTLLEPKVYDATTAAAVVMHGSLSGVVEGDWVSVYATARYRDANAGTDKPVDVSYALSGADAAYYLVPEDLVTSEDITARALQLSDFHFDTEGKVYTGSRIEPALASVNGFVTANDYTVDYTDNISAGTDTGKITVTGKNNASGTLEVYFTIGKATPATDFPTGLNIGTPANLSHIALPDGYTWDEPDTAVQYSAHQYFMTFTPQDTANYLTVTQKVTVIGNDVTSPTGTLTVGEGSWNDFRDHLSFGLFFKNPQTVTVTSGDTESGVAKTEYYLAPAETDDFTAVQWTAFDGTFNIQPNNKYVIYVRITDAVGNAIIINSDGVVLDDILPALSGIENGKTYHQQAQVTVIDANLDRVEVDGHKVTVSDGSFTLTAGAGEQTVVAYDKAGNVSTAVTVTVEAAHTFVWGEWYDNHNGTHSKDAHCLCGAQLTVTAPKQGETVADGLEQEAESQVTDLQLNIETDTEQMDGDALAAIRAQLAAGITAEYVDITVKNVIGNVLIPNTVNVLEIPVAFDFAGKLDITLYRNHQGTVTALNALESRPEASFADGTYYLDREQGIVFVYADRFSVYGVAYHAHSLLHVPPKDATAQADGNIEYWYCEGCYKYFIDAHGEHEITKPETVLTYVPTGNAADLWAWAAVLLAGGVLAMITMRKRKAAR